MKKDIRLIALDIDGTLYQRDGQISAFTKEQIKKAADSGIIVVLSTGRPYVGLPLEDAADLGIRYAITANGAAIYEIPEKKCLFEDGLTPDISIPILQSVYNFHLHMDAFIQGDAYTQASTRDIVRRLNMPESVKSYILTTREIVSDLCTHIKNNSLILQKATLNFESESDGTYIDREEVKSLLLSNSDIKVVSGGFHNLEFTKTGISKAGGLNFLCKSFGLPISSTMVCGDSENDLDIMQSAGFSVAMGNATPQIKSIAHHVTATCDEDGVGLAILDFAL